MRKIPVIALLVCTLLVCMVSCNNNGVTEFGTLEITIDSDVSRGIESLSMETKAYNVTVTDSLDTVVFRSTSSTKTRYTVSVPVGMCNITVEALNKTGDVIGRGYVSGEVVANKTNVFSVSVEEISGNGTFSISIRGTADHSLSYVVKDPAMNVVKQDVLHYSDGRYSASTQLPNGFYTFSIIWDDADEMIKTETIRVVAGKTIVYDAEYLFLVDGSVTLLNEIIETPAIVLSLSAKALTSNKTLTVSADISGIEGESTCFWAVDEQPLGSPAAYEDLELQMADYSEGDHSVSLFVTNGSIIWSESAKFVVLPERPTELEVSGDVELWVIGDVLIPDGLKTTVYYGSRFTRSFSTLGHRIDSLGTESVVLSCSLDYEDYTYYLDSEYDAENNRTVVYVIIDRFIEDPAYLTVSVEVNAPQIDEWDSFGICLNASNTVIAPKQKDSYWKHCGYVAFTDTTQTRTIKVDPDTYSFNGNTWDGFGYFFYVVADKNSVSLSIGQTKSLSFVEGEYDDVTIQLPDVYDDGTEFYFYNYGFEATTEDSGFVLSVRPDYEYSFMLYPKFDKDCYYTVFVDEYTGTSTVTATRHEVLFSDLDVAVSSGRYNVMMEADCLIPDDLIVQLRVGDYYSDYYGLNFRYMRSINVASSGSIEAWCSDPDYSISAKVEGSLITIMVSANYEEYSILNLSYDFDFALDRQNNRVTAITLYDSNRGAWYILPVVDKNKTELKIIPGTYRKNGYYNRISLDGGVQVWPTYSPENFSVSAGESKTITIRMELYVAD